jgi:purine nucleoside phosphorylase
MTSAADALGRVAAFGPHAAVVFGSGLAALPPQAVLRAELGYGELGWPCTAVPGHRNVLQLAELTTGAAAGLRLALACGRPHGYEGWPREELERSVRGLAAAGVSAFVLTNSCGALRSAVTPGEVVVCTAVVDMQAPPPDEAPVGLEVCTAGEARAVAAAVAPAPVRSGVYVAVAGPQFETPAEVAWLAGHGDVVGMSAAPEVRAVRAVGAACCLLALVVNRAAAVGSHEDVLAFGGRLAGTLAAGLGAVVTARWPGWSDEAVEDAPWTS